LWLGWRARRRAAARTGGASEPTATGPAPITYSR